MLDSPTCRLPPPVPSAPAPSRALTVWVAASYSAWSPSAASLLSPALAPLIRREPGTKLTPKGSGSTTATSMAVSLPTLVAKTLYSTTSPSRRSPPLRSVQVFWVPRKLGSSVEMDMANMPSANWSPSVATSTVALVAPLVSRPLTSTTSTSSPAMLVRRPESWGRSPALLWMPGAWDTGTPSTVREELKKSEDEPGCPSLRLSESLSAPQVPPRKRSLSPVRPESPS